jgi:two-component system, OmpR family, response regulator
MDHDIEQSSLIVGRNDRGPSPTQTRKAPSAMPPRYLDSFPVSVTERGQDYSAHPSGMANKLALAPIVDGDRGERADQGGRAPGKETSMPVILVVDDDAELRQMLVGYLERQNMRVLSASGRDDMVHHFKECEPKLMLLDLQLENDDGLDLLRDVRSRSNVPIIITTGHRLEEIDRVVALELGADDYILKPFGLRELLARVRAVLRRHEFGRVASDNEPAPDGFRFAGWRLDRRRRQLFNPSGVQVPLTNGEYSLLVAFLDSAGRPLTREHLLQATRMHEDIYDRSIDVQVLRLRRKVEVDPSAPRAIVTERGVGYRFNLPVEKH